MIVAMVSLPQQNEFWVSEHGIEEKPASADPADSWEFYVKENQFINKQDFKQYYS